MILKLMKINIFQIIFIRKRYYLFIKIRIGWLIYKVKHILTILTKWKDVMEIYGSLNEVFVPVMSKFVCTVYS